MCADRIAKLLQFPVDGPLAQNRFEGSGIEEDVDVLGESLNQVSPFGQTGSALEDDLVAGGSSDHP